MGEQKELKHILIVEDTPQNIDLLVAMLGHQYDLSVAIDGGAALEILKDLQPDLILLDVMIPVLDGFQVCEQIKAAPRLANIPIFFLTAKTATEDIIRGFEVGAVDYITKPFNAAELNARISTHLELLSSRQLVEQQLKELAEANRENKTLLHTLCHDLANPFASISTFSQIIADEPEMSEKFLPIIFEAAGHGLEMIALVRRMEALKDKKLELDDVDLFEAVQQSVMLVNPKLEAKNVHLEVQVKPDSWVQAERTSLINSVINNLLTNAIKFSYPGSQITVSALKRDKAWRLTVADQGTGISPKLLTELFDLSKKTTLPGTEGEEGTGYGMPLIKKFMELYGGVMEITSTAQPDPAHGTQVFLDFAEGEGHV